MRCRSNQAVRTRVQSLPPSRAQLPQCAEPTLAAHQATDLPRRRRTVIGSIVPSRMNSISALAGIRTCRLTFTKRIRRSETRRRGKRAVVPRISPPHQSRATDPWPGPIAVASLRFQLIAFFLVVSDLRVEVRRSPETSKGRAAHGGRGGVEVEVALADETPAGDNLEAVRYLIVFVEGLADVCVGLETRWARSVEPLGAADLPQGDRVGAGLGDRVAAVAEGR
jgi:hypothetical protein